MPSIFADFDGRAMATELATQRLARTNATDGIHNKHTLTRASDTIAATTSDVIAALISDDIAAYLSPRPHTTTRSLLT